MSGVVTVIEELLVATVMSKKGLLPRVSKTYWALMPVSVLLGCGGVFLLILSLDRFLEARYPLDIAALILAAAVFAAAILVAVIASYSRRNKALTLKTAQKDVEKNLRHLIEDVCDTLDDPIQDNPKTAVLLAAFAGFVTAQRQS
jgi:K+ transporter